MSDVVLDVLWTTLLIGSAVVIVWIAVSLGRRTLKRRRPTEASREGGTTSGRR